MLCLVVGCELQFYEFTVTGTWLIIIFLCSVSLVQPFPCNFYVLIFKCLGRR